MKPGFRFRRVLRLAVLAILWLGILVGGAAQTGRLAGATSPYLLLHADDAIDWHPWGNEALRRAEREGKLIFSSAERRLHVFRRMPLTTRSAVGLGVPGFRLISTPWWLR